MENLDSPSAMILRCFSGQPTWAATILTFSAARHPPGKNRVARNAPDAPNRPVPSEDLLPAAPALIPQRSNLQSSTFRYRLQRLGVARAWIPRKRARSLAQLSILLVKHPL